MKDYWVSRLFVERSDLFLRIMNQKWLKTEELTNGLTKVLDKFGIKSGNLLDLCCGNGRVSIYMAKKGFKTVGVDISRAFLEDAGKKAREHEVTNLVTFLEGDVRDLNKIIGNSFQGKAQSYSWLRQCILNTSLSSLLPLPTQS